MSGSNCCFLTHIQVSQETVKVVCYSHLFRNEKEKKKYIQMHVAKLFVHSIALVQEPPECQKPCETPYVKTQPVPAHLVCVSRALAAAGWWRVVSASWALASLLCCSLTGGKLLNIFMPPFAFI